jgi:hypothetical protein
LENISEFFLPQIMEGKGKGGGLGSGTERVLSTKLETKGIHVLLFWEGRGNDKLPVFQVRYHLPCVKEPGKGDRKSLLNSLMCCT